MMPAPTPAPLKRILLTYANGIEQIIGLTDIQPGPLLTLPMNDASTRQFSLVRVTPRVVHYREIPGSKTPTVPEAPPDVTP